jgi:hypothetical protein
LQEPKSYTTSASAQTGSSGRRRADLEMGGAAQNIAVADMIAFVCIKCDDEALEAREVRSRRSRRI